MRVAVVSPETVYHREDDDTRRLDRHLRQLVARGHEVTVLCAKWVGTPESAGQTDTSANPTPDAKTNPAADGLDGDDGGVVVDLDNIDVREIAGVTYRWLVEDVDERRGFFLRAPLAIRSTRPDVIHAFGSPSSIMAARFGSTLARAPLVAEWYDATDADGGLWTTRQAARRPDRTIVPSRLVRRQLRELGADQSDLRVVPTGVRFDQIREVEPADAGEIVYARQLDDDANLESLFLGLAELRDRDWSATVIGDGSARADYERQARDLRIDDRITFAGACDRDDRIAIYRDAHVFVQTARRCPFAKELLWALACGCVGIVEYHAQSSAHELVEGRERGFRTTTPDEMADAIQQAGRYEHMTVDDSFLAFDEGEVVERYLDCYQEALEEYGLL